MKKEHILVLSILALTAVLIAALFIGNSSPDQRTGDARRSSPGVIDQAAVRMTPEKPVSGEDVRVFFKPGRLIDGVVWIEYESFTDTGIGGGSNILLPDLLSGEYAYIFQSDRMGKEADVDYRFIITSANGSRTWESQDYSFRVPPTTEESESPLKIIDFGYTAGSEKPSRKGLYASIINETAVVYVNYECHGSEGIPSYCGGSMSYAGNGSYERKGTIDSMPANARCWIVAKDASGRRVRSEKKTI